MQVLPRGLLETREGLPRPDRMAHRRRWLPASGLDRGSHRLGARGRPDSPMADASEISDQDVAVAPTVIARYVRDEPHAVALTHLQP